LGRLGLPNGSTAYLDAAPIIYSVEKNPYYGILMTEIWEHVEAGNIRVVTSELSLLEVLVHPVRNKDHDLIHAYESLLTASQMSLVPITTDVLRLAANIRATQNFKTPDAIHAATASLAGCSHFVTNDPTFRRLDAAEVVVLRELL